MDDGIFWTRKDYHWQNVGRQLVKEYGKHVYGLDGNNLHTGLIET